MTAPARHQAPAPAWVTIAAIGARVRALCSRWRWQTVTCIASAAAGRCSAPPPALAPDLAPAAWHPVTLPAQRYVPHLSAPRIGRTSPHLTTTVRALWTVAERRAAATLPLAWQDPAGLLRGV
jgi:hypothetical protein